MRRRSTILRLLLAITVFTVAFCLLRELYLIGALVVASSTAGIVLFTRKRQVRHVLRALVSCGIGAFLAEALSPKISPPYEHGDEFHYMIVGAIVGWLLGPPRIAQITPDIVFSFCRGDTKVTDQVAGFRRLCQAENYWLMVSLYQILGFRTVSEIRTIIYVKVWLKEPRKI